MNHEKHEPRRVERRKWKNADGYPTLPHSGLSVIEVFVTWIDLSLMSKEA